MSRDHLYLTTIAALAALAGCSDEPQANPQGSGAGIVAIAPPPPPPPPSDNAATDVPPATSAPANPAAASEQPADQAAPAEYAAFAPPVALYYETEDKIADLFEQVAGGLAPAEAAPSLQALTTEYQPRIRPYWLWAATATNDQKNAMVAKRLEMLSARHGGKPPMRTSEMIDLARQPGNDSFKVALAALFQAQGNGAPRLHAAQAQKLLDQLNR